MSALDSSLHASTGFICGGEIVRDLLIFLQKKTHSWEKNLRANCNLAKGLLKFLAKNS